MLNNFKKTMLLKSVLVVTVIGFSISVSGNAAAPTNDAPMKVGTSKAPPKLAGKPVAGGTSIAPAATLPKTLPKPPAKPSAIVKAPPIPPIKPIGKEQPVAAGGKTVTPSALEAARAKLKPVGTAAKPSTAASTSTGPKVDELLAAKARLKPAGAGITTADEPMKIGTQKAPPRLGGVALPKPSAKPAAPMAPTAEELVSARANLRKVGEPTLGAKATTVNTGPNVDAILAAKAKLKPIGKPTEAGTTVTNEPMKIGTQKAPPRLGGVALPKPVAKPATGELVADEPMKIGTQKAPPRLGGVALPKSAAKPAIAAPMAPTADELVNARANLRKVGEPTLGAKATTVNTGSKVDELVAARARLKPVGTAAKPLPEAPLRAGTPPMAPTAADLKRTRAGLRSTTSPASLEIAAARQQAAEKKAATAAALAIQKRGEQEPLPGEEVQEEIQTAEQALEPQAPQAAPAKKKGFFGSMASAAKKSVQKATVAVKKQFTGKCVPGHVPESEEERIACQSNAQRAMGAVKKQFTGKCVPGHVPESEEERIACQSNVRRAMGAVKKNVLPTKGAVGETAEEREIRIASENPMQQASRQMREQGMMAAGKVAQAGTAAVTARTQQLATKVTTGVTKRIEKIAPKPVIAPPIVETPVVQEQYVEPEQPFEEQQQQVEEPSVQEGTYDPNANAQGENEISATPYEDQGSDQGVNEAIDPNELELVEE